LASTPQTIYRPDIDGLRGFSIVLTLIYHGFSYPLPGGFIGVDIFFVISGYLITGQIYDRARAGSFSFLDFYSRRIRRIFPPLLVVLTFVCFYGYFRFNLDDFISLFKHVAAGTVFMSNYVLWQEVGYFDQKSALKPLLHLWSLAIEEQFYIVWPLLVVALTAASRRYRGTLTRTLILVCATSLAYRMYLGRSDSIATFYSPLSRFWELGIGGLLAVLELNNARIFGLGWSQGARHFATAAGSICLIVCAFFLSGQHHFAGLLATLPALSTVAIIAAGPGAFINHKLLASKPMIELGLISYALYLWHWPLLSFIHIEGIGNNSPIAIWLALAISFVLAAITRTVVEQPIRTSRERRMPLWLIYVSIVIGMVGVLGYKADWFRPQRLLMQAQIHKQVLAAFVGFNNEDIPHRSCVELVDADKPGSDICQIWGDDTAKNTVVVWGDSMAYFWMPAFLTQVRDHGWRVIQLSQFNCPPIINVRRTDREDLVCKDTAYAAAIMDVIRKAKPDVVFLISRWNLFYHGHIKNDVLVDKSFITDGPEPGTAESAKRTFEHYLPETISKLAEISRVVVFRDSPVMKVPVDVGISTRPYDFEPTLADHQQFEAPINKVLDAAAARVPGAIIFDPSERLCNASRCPAYIAGQPAYFDEIHFTSHAALQFAPDILSLGDKQ